MLNVIYGVLVDGNGVRATSANRQQLSKRAATHLGKLIPVTLPIEEKDAIAELIIRILQSYDNYTSIVAAIDPVNTYDDYMLDLPINSTITMDTLYMWSKESPVDSNDVKRLDTDDPITYIQKAIIAILIAK